MKEVKFLIRFFMILGLLLTISSCEEDPFEDIVSDDRQFLSFKIPGQIGPAVIKNIEDDQGTIEVFAVLSVDDLSSIIPDFTISKGAQVNPAVGETVNFNNESFSTVYEVQSESGKIRRWNITVSPYRSQIEGEWAVSQILFDWHIGLNETWGWGVYGEYDPVNGYNPDNYAPEVFSNDFPNVAFEEDNLIEFITTTINENGNPEGTFTFAPGPDGQYASFILDPDHTGGSRDYSERFRKIHTGSGVWEFNEGSRVLTLWKDNKAGLMTQGVLQVDDFGNIRIAYDTWINEFTWDHFDAESHIQSAYNIYYYFNRP